MTTTISDLAGNVIEQRSRAIISHLTPLTGARATGRVLLRATGPDVVLGPNRYARAAVGQASKQLSDAHLFKTAFNPETEREHKLGGAWTVTSAGVEVDFVSAVGGQRFNLKAGTKLLFEPLIAGLEPMGVVVEDFAGGTTGPVKSVVIYDELTDEHASNLAQSGTLDAPAFVLGWLSSTPVEGRLAGLMQGRSRKSKTTRAYFESYVLYTIAGNFADLGSRRREGLELMQMSRLLLSDRKRNDDGERLSVLGAGLEILDSGRTVRNEATWIFFTRFRLVASITAVDTRTFNPWLVMRERPQYPGAGTEPEDLLYGHDQKKNMPRE